MKHTQAISNDYPTGRKIRRECSKELYRTLKRMNVYIDKTKLTEAEKYYTKMVITHYQLIRELSKDRKKQVQWWEEHCSKALAELLEVEHAPFVQAFKQAYLGTEK